MFHLVATVLNYFKYKSVIALILVNLVPLYGVYYQGWSIMHLVILYWCENVIIGFYNVFKMLYNTNPDVAGVKVNGKEFTGNAAQLKVSLIPFFILHYGIFVFVHGFFIITFFISSLSQNNIGRELGDIPYVLLSTLMIFISHGI